MSITKQFLKSKPVCKAKFRLEKDSVNGAEQAFLVGDFNDWDELALPMRRLKDGAFTAQVDLESGREYRFRYLVDGDWVNDDAADRYEFCDFAGTENSVISA